MRWADTAVLRAMSVSYDAEGNPAYTADETEVFVNRYSFGASSYMAAKSAGLHADARIQLRTADYDGQEEVRFDGDVYLVEQVEQSGDLTVLDLARRLGDD